MSHLRKTDRCAMSTPTLPAASLRPHIFLPDRWVLPRVVNHLIYIVLWSIGGVILRAQPHFLPALREAGAAMAYRRRGSRAQRMAVRAKCSLTAPSVRERTS